MEAAVCPDRLLGMEEGSDQAEPDVSQRAACMKRRAWAQSRDSIWQDPGPQLDPHHNPVMTSDSGTPHGHTMGGKREGGDQGPSEYTGRLPNKITSWLNECRTPLGASLDDQSVSPSKGAQRNGCSFEDDLSLGAEANHLQSSSAKAETPCYVLPAQDKRSQFKQKGRSMNSTGSGKSSAVSSVSELLDLYEEDPEEILYNLGFGREEPDMASKVPTRFFSNTSGARGIDIKVYLGAQLQRMELENPNYALTSRFRQIQVLTTVANELFQLYSQVSGQPIQRIGSRDQGGGEGGGRAESETLPSPLKRNNSALNAAKILKKTLSKHNLLGGVTGTPDTLTPPANHPQPEHTHINHHTHTQNGQTHPSFSVDREESCSTDADHRGEQGVKQKALRKKDSPSLATVTEETNGGGGGLESAAAQRESDRLTDDSHEQSPAGPAASEEQQSQSADLKLANEMLQEGGQGEERNLTSTPEKPPLLHLLADPHLAQLRLETKESFEMEEVQSNEDEALPGKHSASRTSDLLRTASHQSDSSGFAEEPSTDSTSSLKVQESSDSCDSETTVTSHTSHDLATPLATPLAQDLTAFDRLVGVEGEEPGGAAEAVGSRGSSSAEGHDGSCSTSEVLQSSGHQIPQTGPGRADLEQTQPQSEVPPSSEMEPNPCDGPVSDTQSVAEARESECDGVFVDEQASQGVCLPSDAPESVSDLLDGTEAVLDSTEAVCDVLDSTEAVLDSTEAVCDLLDSTEAVLDSTEAVCDLLDSTEAVLDSTEAVSDLLDSTEAVLDSTEAVCDLLDSTEAVLDSTEAVCDLLDSTEAVLDSTEAVSDLLDGTEAVLDSTEAVSDLLDSTEAVCPTSPSSLLLQALNRAKLNHQHFQKQRAHSVCQQPWERVEAQPREARPVWGRGRGRVPLQRSCSLPSSLLSLSSSLLSPLRVVSSVRIQFGRGAAMCCTPPKYSYRYTCPEEEEEKEGEEEEEEEEGKSSCLSTLLINPTSSQSNDQLAPTPFPRPLPRHLAQSSYSLQSPSPPPDWLEKQQVDHAPSWNTQSAPNLFSNQNQPGPLLQSLSTNQNQPTWNPSSCQMDFSSPSPGQYPNPNSYPSPAQCLNPSPYPYQAPVNFPHPQAGFCLNPSPRPAPLHPYPAPLHPYPAPLHPYSSVPNLSLYSPSSLHHSSLNSLHLPSNPTIPQYGSLNSQHTPTTPSMPHHCSLFNLQQPSNPMTPHQSFNHPHLPIGSYSPQSPYYTPPLGSPYASPYHGYSLPPHHAFPYTPSPYHRPASAPIHSLYPGLVPTPGPGCNPGLAPGYSPYPGFTATPAPGCVQGPSSMEMLLRRVLHEIRGTVLSLNQTASANRGDTPSHPFNQHTAAMTPQQSVAELQQKRRSLNAFRSQMMDLELSIIRQQALVYTHLSPDDRLQVEQLEALRKAVREELQELEIQLEDRMKLHHMRLHRDSSVDSMSTSSALRAMDPVSDLLREQLYLQSELDYEGGNSVDHTPSVGPSSRSSSPIRASCEPAAEQKPAVFRASINITPAPPPRANTHTEEKGKEEEERREREEKPLEERRGGGVENLQQLIREIRESVAEEIRQEIYNELLAAASPRRSPLATRNYPL